MFTGALVFPVQMILVICFRFIAISKMYIAEKTRDVKYSKELNPELQDFDTWLKDNAKKIPLD